MAPEPVPPTVRDRPLTVAWRRTAADLGNRRLDAVALDDGDRSAGSDRGGGSVDDGNGHLGGAHIGTRDRSRLDESVWCGWWRDLIVERYRHASFDEIVPLPEAARCPWSERVRLGRLVEESLVGQHGPDAISRLVVEALDAAGFGAPRQIVGSTGAGTGVGPRRFGSGTATGGGDELRAGLLGSIADALLRSVPPSEDHDVDLRVGAATDRSSDDGVVATVTAGVRDGVLAYAGHVEAVASRSLIAVRALPV